MCVTSVIGEGDPLGFLWLVLSWQWGQKCRRPAVTDGVQAIWGRALWGLIILPFLDLRLQTVGWFIFICGLAVVS